MVGGQSERRCLRAARVVGERIELSRQSGISCSVRWVGKAVVVVGKERIKKIIQE